MLRISFRISNVAYRLFSVGLLGCLAIAACGPSTDLGSSDLDYIRTTVDLVTTRSALPVGTDSLTVLRTLDSLYARHHTTSKEYVEQTADLANDPPKAQKIFEAVRDSLKKTKRI